MARAQRGNCVLSPYSKQTAASIVCLMDFSFFVVVVCIARRVSLGKYCRFGITSTHTRVNSVRFGGAHAPRSPHFSPSCSTLHISAAKSMLRIEYKSRAEMLLYINIILYEIRCLFSLRIVLSLQNKTEYTCDPLAPSFTLPWRRRNICICIN